jgi:hypothetical protein
MDRWIDRWMDGILDGIHPFYSQILQKVSHPEKRLGSVAIGAFLCTLF